MTTKNDEKTVKNEAIKYANACLNDEIIACKMIKLACKRFLNDIDESNKSYYYDEKDPSRFRLFCQTAKHSTGEYNNKPFVLQPFQLFMIANLLGIKQRSNNYRKYTRMYFQLGRKNGKSSLISILSLYFLTSDNEPDAQVTVLTNALHQSKNNVEMTRQYAESLDPTKKYITPRNNSFNYFQKGKLTGRLTFKPTNVKSLDGTNDSMIIIDEFHSGRQEVYNVMKSGQGNRRQGLLCVVTTAGTDITSYCHTLYTNYKKMLLGEIEQDEKQLILIYELDDEDIVNDSFMTNEELWYKANPNLDVTVFKEFIRDELKTILVDYSQRAPIIVKNLNCWTDGDAGTGEFDKYIGDEVILNSMQKLDLEQFRGKFAFIGVDLSHCNDLNAVSLLIPNLDGKHYFYDFLFLPENSTNIKDVKSRLAVWQREGYITLTPGNAQDAPSILKCIKDLIDVYGINVQEVHYDEHNSMQFQMLMQDELPNIPMVVCAQSFLNFNLPTKELKIALLQDRVIINQNSVVRWNYHNAIIKETNQGNVKVCKLRDNPSNKIDSVVGHIQALNGFLTSNFVRENN